jgi:hypothetical protein
MMFMVKSTLGMHGTRPGNFFCGDDPRNMPLALVIFGDKAHLDLHGTLSILPLTFTLSCFNEHSRTKSEFWRPLSFIPNLSYGATSSKNSSKPLDSVQDEHDCLNDKKFYPINIILTIMNDHDSTLFP